MRWTRRAPRARGGRRSRGRPPLLGEPGEAAGARHARPRPPGRRGAGRGGRGPRGHRPSSRRRATAPACSPAAATVACGEGGEVAVGGEAGGEGGVPDPAGAAPRAPRRSPGRREHEGPVGDAAVDVHAAVVVGGVDVVGHRADLGVLADLRVVVRRAGVRHRPQRPAVDAGQEDALADQPVGLVGVLAEVALLDAGAEDVGDRLVQRAGLPLVGEVGRELRDRVARARGPARRWAW